MYSDSIESNLEVAFMIEDLKEIVSDWSEKTVGEQ